MEKNVASQKWMVFAFDRTDNTPKTGDAANITANLRIDGAAANPVDDTNPTELEDGYYVFDITQAESNGNQILISPASSTGDIQVIGAPGVYDTTAPNYNAMGIESDGDLTKVNTLDGHTAQTGDSFAVVNSGTHGNAQLVRSTTPANSLDVTSAGNAGIDWGNVANQSTSVNLSATDIRTVSTTTDVTNQVTADMTAVSGDSDAADNLEANFDGNGYVADTAPATQAQLAGLQTGAAGVSVAADSYLLTTGTQSSGTIANTTALDGVSHQHTDDGGVMNLYYEFLIGSGSPSSILVNEALTGNNDNLGVYGYDWVTTAWVQVGTLDGTVAATINEHTYNLTTSMVGTGANLGKVRLRYYAASGLTTATLHIDRIWLSFNQGVGGYSDGIEVDTNASNTNTVPGVDGIKGNPVSTWAAALTLSTATGIKEFLIHNGSAIELTASIANYSMTGEGWSLNLSDEVIDGAYIHGACTVIGTGTNGATRPTFEHCCFGAATIPASEIRNCGFGIGSGTFTGQAAGQYLIIDGFSAVPGQGAPPFVFTGLGSSTGINNRGWKGGATYTLDSDCTLSHEVLAGGTTTITTGGGDAEIRGITRALTLVLSAAETVQFAGITGHVTLSGTTTATVKLYGIITDIVDSTSAATVDDDTVNNTRQVATLADTNELQGDLTDGGRLDLILDATLADTDELQTNQGDWATATSVNLEDDAITAAKFDESTAFPVVLTDTGSTKIARTGADSDTLETISDQIDGVSAGVSPSLMLDTTISSITSQVEFVVAAGSDVDDAYNNQAVVFYDISNSDYPSMEHVCTDYVGSTRTVTVDSAPNFTIANGQADKFKVFQTAPGTVAPTAEQNADAVWDEVLTGATHNVSTSAGRRLRELAGTVITADTCQAGSTTNTIVLATGASSTDDSYDPALIAIVNGTGAGQSRLIYQYAGSTRTGVVDRNWKVVPDNTSEYIIYADPGREHVNEGQAQAGSANTITLNALASSATNAYRNQYVFIRSGTGDDQVRRVIGYNGTSKVATISHNWATNPDVTSGYAILPMACVEVQAVKDTELGTNTGANFDTFFDDSGATATVVSDIDTIGTNVDSVLTDTGTTIPAQITSVHGTTDGLINTVDGNVDSILTDTGTTIPAQITSVHGTTDGKIDAVKVDTAATLEDTGTTLPAQISAIDTKIDTIDTNVDTINGNTDGLQIKKNTALANFPFLMVLASDHVTAATGLTVTATRSIDGAAFASCSNAVTEIGNGNYKISLSAGDMNGDTISLRFAAATADTRNINIITVS